MKPITVVLLGAYWRGKVYGDFAQSHPDLIKIVGVAEWVPLRRQIFCEKYDIDPAQSTATWEEMLSQPKKADAIIIALPDNLHYASCMKAIELGYDVLLEKPMAQTLEECKELAQAAREKGVITGHTFVLSYSPYFLLMRRMIAKKIIGDVVSIQHLEPVCYLNFVLSYVRGSWKNSDKTTPLIVAKSIHDLDIFNWILGCKCTKLVAMGGRKYFRPEDAPEGSGERCLSCSCESTCTFSAKKIHLVDKQMCDRLFDLSPDPSKHEEEIIHQLNTTDYGKCVYKCGGNQPDHYIMSMEYENGTTVSFSTEAFTSYRGRRTRIMGTKGDFVGDMDSFTHTDFLTNKQTTYKTVLIDPENYKEDGHGGGDYILTKAWVEAVQKRDQSLAVSFDEALESHLMGFAAEESRINGTIVKLDQ